MTSRRAFTSSLASMTLAMASTGVLAQAGYPSKNIEVVVPFAPGGGTDNLMRTITGIMDENKWSPVALNVNNRVGGSGTVGYSYLIGKKGDSHVIAGATPMVVSGKLQGRLPGNHRDAMTMLITADAGGSNRRRLVPVSTRIFGASYCLSSCSL